MRINGLRRSQFAPGLVALGLTLGLVLLGGCASTVGSGTEKLEFDPTSHPLILRRQTLIVRDIDRSLALYRDAMGMEVIYDNTFSRPRKDAPGEQDIRLVFLKASDAFVGALGLVDYESGAPDHASHTKSVRHEGFTPGNSVVLFNTTELDERWPVISKVPGVRVINGPTMTEYPSYDGTDTIRINVTRFYDPDGFLVEYNQPQETIR